ncbi:hypothetical protein LINPERHAP1_LOCUS4362 [Linum perenne]
MKRAAEITGLDSVSVDLKDKKLTVTGDDFDPVKVVSKLRKLFHTDIVTVGEPKKPEAKKEEPAAKKTEEGGKDKKNPEQEIVSVGEPKKPEAKKKEEPAAAAKKDGEGGKDKKTTDPVPVVPVYYNQQQHYPNGYYQNYNYAPYPKSYSYNSYGRYAQVPGDDPNACVIM